MSRRTSSWNLEPGIATKMQVLPAFVGIAPALTRGR
jgi:hypothetical protein